MFDEINNKLINNIVNTNKNKSSHWKKYLPDNADYLNPFGHLGFGAYSKKNIKNFIHNLLTRAIFGNNVFKTKTYYAYKSVFDKINRFIDIDTVRHIFTFEKLKEHVNPKSICIIGDGKINGVLGAHLTFPNAKIYSVNLSETLINDNMILELIDIDLKKSITLITDLNFPVEDAMLTLIPSNLKKILLNKNIELFINIASFQEMVPDEVNEYFEIIKDNKSKLYCCNRQYKKLPCGEELYFENTHSQIQKKFFGRIVLGTRNFTL